MYKRSIIQIENQDNLCCARAIVTAKAKTYQHPQYSSFRHGEKIQERTARELHEEAGIPLGTCGYEELKAFAQTDSRLSYRVTSFSSDLNDRNLILFYTIMTSSPVCLECLEAAISVTNA